ncbi:hypothetical protein [Colwellia sp. BRX8-7]|jgi:phosphatidylserine synthase|uniref:hypothetical protein n=1 Tax=Colwellia sp. BRX8-7 TaxID=2759833 RepID=UPI002175090E|nr:hypothetical protein [Colwellia sp. BRX8-7]
MEWLNHTNNFKALSAVLANNKFVIALLFISIFYMIKYLIVRRIKRKSKQDKRLQINVVNNIFTVLIIVMVFNIWSEEIQKFAFSIAALL